MSLFDTVFELIDMRSFSNLWFWIALAAVWTTACHYTLGAPYGLVVRAGRGSAEAQSDLETLVRIRVSRQMQVAESAGPWLVGFAAAALSALLSLGFAYGVEFAQAVFLIAAPLTLVSMRSHANARLIHMADLRGDALRARLNRQRHLTQTIAVISIFFTTAWGMYRNLAVGPFGG